MIRTSTSMKLIYFHGFGSSAASGTIRTLREKLPDFDVIAPDIPVDPAEALPFLRELCEKEQPNVSGYLDSICKTISYHKDMRSLLFFRMMPTSLHRCFLTMVKLG